MSAKCLSLVCCKTALALLLSAAGSAPALASDAQGAGKEPRTKGRAIWCNPWHVGKSQEEIVAYVERLDRAHINMLVMCVKSSSGYLCWPSKRFPQAIARGFDSFDFPKTLIDECHKRNMQVHAWFVDFSESNHSPAFREHPEWAMLDVDGNPTSSQTLRGKPYDTVWMCPAQRPGYADQWLIPMMVEFAERYEVDGIHHDYVRYPGDLAPDEYCFCDYCMEQMPKFAGYASESHPDEAFLSESYDRPYLEAHWEPSPRVLPPNWDALSRGMKGRFLRDGSFFQGGRRDLDYFFYLYRAEAVERFARESTEAVRRARPGIEVSAALFKNPVHSGRFIGQDWRRYAPYIEYCMPMDYRSHYPGDFETYLDLLEESVLRQKNDWARSYKHFWPGIAVTYLYKEEKDALRNLLSLFEANAEAKAIAAEFEKIAPRIQIAAPQLHAQFLDFLKAESPSAEQRTALAEAFRAFEDDVPPAFWPKEKFVQTMQRLRATDVEGIVIFDESQIGSYGLWEALTEIFSE